MNTPEDNSRTNPEWRESTRSVHAGEHRKRAHHAIVDPIVQSSNFSFEDSADVKEYMRRRERGEGRGRSEYARYGNPTVDAVEDRLAALENAEEAVLFSSGMAAITSAIMTYVQQGDHVIMTDDCYRRTREFMLNFLARFGVSVSMVPLNDLEALKAAVRLNTKIFFSETPTNPYLRVLDLPAWVAAAKEVGALTMLDATFATPVNLKPLDWGVDVVLHSGTKYLGGHNDLLAGCAAGSHALMKQLRETVFTMGPVLDPLPAFLLLRGIKTLGLRVQHQNKITQQVAEFLADHPAIEEVWYPGLPNHPDHAIAKAQMSGFGGVISFTVKGDFDQTGAFIDHLKIPYLTPSLGAVESLVTQPALMSYTGYTADQRRAMGVRDNLVRYSVGIEDARDLIDDLDQALHFLLGLKKR